LAKVLMVEDHADIRTLIRMTLDFEGHDIHEAVDGESGLAAVRALHPDVLLLDIMMPGELDGYDVCRALRADPAFADLPIVLLTARGQATDLAMGEAAGATAYMIKPFNPDDLIDTVARLAAGRGA
jgi:CheY-like chemotaxis protein